MSSMPLRRAAPMVFPAVGKHTATVLFAHGLGDTAAGWAHAVQFWRQDRRLNQVKFVLPNAPIRPITLNGGLQMPGWFDMRGMLSTPEINMADVCRDAAGYLESQTYLDSLIQEEISAGTPADRIVLGGFSQGGTVSVFAALASPVKLAGAVGLSCFLDRENPDLKRVVDQDLDKSTPIFLGHGDKDDIVCLEYGKASEATLKELGYPVTFKTYSGMGHSATMSELQDVAAFLAARLPPQAS
ncbi:hypothetical protein XA68_14738 [Ophiocordyceps unilateralis]|uniref:Acyl-protein thioesterase 1 n=1 Tax=Ophiocordyceps unilateralis TaxID=268505 RepID=A0A2A9P894_OPHUN|nr:hypothetical protein XA68_14738 [Ophiocordyceps unilateralis]